MQIGEPNRDAPAIAADVGTCAREHYVPSVASER